MAKVATITLESSNGDSVVISDSKQDYFADEIVLDTGPEGLYDTEFTSRTQSGAFEPGGRIIGTEIPIREMTLPFHLTPASRPRFQRLWGTVGNLRKVRYHYDGPSGRRSLTLKLAKNIAYSTEDGFDAGIDDTYYAVVKALAVNPNFEGKEDVAEWVNPGNFTVYIAATSGTFKLGYAGELMAGTLPCNTATIEQITTALEGLSTIGAGNVTVTGNAKQFTVVTPNTCPGMLTVDGTSLAPLSFSITLGTLNFTITIGDQTTAPISFTASATTIRQAIEQLSNIGTGGVTVVAKLFGFTLGFNTGPLNGFLVALFTGHSTAGIHVARVVTNPNTSWFEVWNPTDQDGWLEWELDPADEWQFPDFAFGQERKWNRAVGEDAARMIVTAPVTSMLSVMSDPFMDTWLPADLSNFAGVMNGVEPIYAVPPYTGVSQERVVDVDGKVHIVRDEEPVLAPVVCRGPSGAKVTLRQRRFWSAESGLE